MPLHGKIVVIKRSGGDGTEFPLTAACLFGRTVDCDIRIQLPQVSKEHCKIELNENKEVIITNLSSVNPTCINGEVLQQSERLKHGDLITVVDRSFRFEYPPAPTPKKRRSSTVKKSETLQVLQDQQVIRCDLSSDPCLKDGTNIVKLQQTDKSCVVEPKEDGRLGQNTNSPFCELYEMVKQSLDSKTQRMTSGSQPQTPASRLSTTKPVSPTKGEKFVIPASDQHIVKTSEVEEGVKSEKVVVSVSQPGLEDTSSSEIAQVTEETRPMEVATATTPIQGTPKNKKRTPLPQTPTTDGENSTPVSQKISFQVTPPKATAGELVESITLQNTPTRRKSRQSDAMTEEPKTPTDSVVSSDEQTKVPTESLPSTPKAGPSRSPRSSPRTTEKKLKAQDMLQTAPISVIPSVKKRKSGDLVTPLPVPVGKRKRVSFGTQLSPELFDKRLPPDSPLRKGATPSRRSMCLAKNKQSLLRRASVIGCITEHPSPKGKASPDKKASPKRSVSSTKTPSPAKRSPKVISPAKAKTPSPRKDKSPKQKTKTPSPGKKSKEASLTPKLQKTPKSSSPAQIKTPIVKRRSSVAASLSEPQTASEVTGTTTKTPTSSSKQTPSVQGRFSVSRVSTPSPVAEHDSVPESSASATPRVRRKSMKSAKKSALRGALEVMRRRRSGVSRASFKVMNSWADIVKFGQTKSQTLISTKKTITKRKTIKKAGVPKPKTPARKLKEHASTGHADSPMTIVVGKAHKIRAVEPSVGAPKLVHNMALLPKNMKMDEDLTGVAEIFSTPASSKQRKSVSNAQSDIKTPLQIQSMCLIETSLMNTPEETGEMVVSPLTVASTAKQGKYNVDAVSRLLQDNEGSFITEVPAQEPDNEVPHSVNTSEIPPSSEELLEPNIEMSTPKQKPEQPDCLTGVKRMMTTPKQKREPVEDLRGRLLKTPRAPKVSEVVFEGVKELLETPKPAPVLDEVTGTQDVKTSPQVCATKRIMKTPKEKGVPVEDMVGVKRLMKTPKVKGEMVEKDFGINTLVKTPKLKASGPVEDFEGLQDLMQEPAQDETISPDLSTEEPQEVCQVSTEAASESSGDMQTVSQTDEAEMEEKDLATLDSAACEDHREDVSVPSDDIPNVSPAVAVELPQLEVTQESDLATEQPHVLCEEHAGLSAPLDDMQVVSQRAEVETPQPYITDEKVEAPNTSTPLETTQDPEPADKDEPEMTLISSSSETTAPDVPVRVRGRKRTEEVVRTSIRQSGRGRVAQSDLTRPSVAPVEDLTVAEKLIPDLPPASKPKRGRKTKHDAEEKAETLPDTDAVNSQITGTEITTSQDPISEVALEKPRRGKKSMQSSAEPPVAVQVPRVRRGRLIKQESADEEVVPQKESVETIETFVPVEKPRRGRKGKQESVEQPESVEVLQKDSLETIEKSVPVEKPKRARRGKQVSVEQAATVEPVVDVPLIQKEEVHEVPASKPKRAKKTKQDSVEQVKESSSVAASVEAPVCQEIIVMATEKPKTGRRLKQEAVEQVNEPTVEKSSVEPVENEVQDQQAAGSLLKPKRGGRKPRQGMEVEAAPAPTVTPAEKPKRGRRGKQDIPTQEEKVVAAEPVLSVETEAPEEVKVPVSKPGRGRKVTAIVKEEIAPPSSAKKARRGAAASVEEVSEAVAPVTKSTTRGRGIKISKDAPLITEIKAEPVKRGRKGAKSADAVPDKTTIAPHTEEISVDEEMAAPEVEVKKGKGRLSKRVKTAETVQADQTEVNQESAVENTRKPSKSVNWKAQLEMTREFQAVTPVPARPARGRRAKVDAEEPIAAEPTAVKVAVKRKPLKNSEKADESGPSDPVPAGPVKRARRGAKSTEAAPLTDITEATAEVTNASASVGPPAKGKSRVSKKAQVLSVDTEQNEEQKSKPRRGRAGKL